MFQTLVEDLRRYGGPWRQIKALLFAPRVWAIVSYRFSRWCYTARMLSVVRMPLKIFARVVSAFVEMVTSIELPPQATIGPGLFIPHPGYIVVALNTKIGRYCTLTQGVSIGHNPGGAFLSSDGPDIGDRVYVGPGAAVLGPIKIGDDVLIGANAVVTRSVPSGAVVAGNPAQVISMRGSFDFVSYAQMESDPERMAALNAARPNRTSDITEDQASDIA